VHINNGTRHIQAQTRSRHASGIATSEGFVENVRQLGFRDAGAVIAHQQLDATFRCNSAHQFYRNIIVCVLYCIVQQHFQA